MTGEGEEGRSAAHLDARPPARRRSLVSVDRSKLFARGTRFAEAKLACFERVELGHAEHGGVVQHEVRVARRLSGGLLVRAIETLPAWPLAEGAWCKTEEGRSKRFEKG